MIQILRTDNPLFAPGLKFPQRLCYFNAMCHFLYAVPRLIFLTAPLIYLLLNHTNIPGYWAAILAYALPHLTLSNVTNSRIQGEHRHSFWNEIYETVLSPYILLPTMMALINPKLGKFNVTAKGGVVRQHVLRHQDRAAVPDYAAVQHRRAADCHSALLHLGSRPAGHGADERDLVLLQCRHSGRLHGGRARDEAVAHHRPHQYRVPPVAGQDMPDGASDAPGKPSICLSGGTSIRFAEAVDLTPQSKVRLAFPLPSAAMELPGHRGLL